ncbi:MAG: V-type ATPase subunit [Myxococcaceae bacterium]|nr:V-type ATPase subunit [Myxococcaceae bacterium]
MTDFTAVAARARGLATHLFTRPELEALTPLDVPAISRALARSGKLPAAESAPAAELDRVLREVVKNATKTLARWSGAEPVLEVFAADADRRSLRALLRGALQAAPADARLAGLFPTRTLPERVLSELARQPTPNDVARHLVAVDHPDAGRLSVLTAKQAQPDLFALELALVQGFAERATRAARAGDEVLERFVATRLDVLDLAVAVLLSTALDVDPTRCFVDGGRIVTRAAFLEIARSGGKPHPPLRKVVAGTLLAPLAVPLVPDASTIERQAFTLLLGSLKDDARRQPLTCAPVLFYLVRLEAMAHDLRRIIWAATQGAPAALVRPELVSP